MIGKELYSGFVFSFSMSLAIKLCCTVQHNYSIRQNGEVDIV